jgi:hypothetical protein
MRWKRLKLWLDSQSLRKGTPGYGTIQNRSADLAKFACELACESAKSAKELEKAQGQRTEPLPTDGRSPKNTQLKDAGISTSAAQRYEELAEGKEEQAPKEAGTQYKTLHGQSRVSRVVLRCFARCFKCSFAWSFERRIWRCIGVVSRVVYGRNVPPMVSLRPEAGGTGRVI